MKIGIVGAGTMGSSMAQIFAAYKYETTLYNHRAETLERAKERIDAEVRDKIIYTTELTALSDAELIVENIVEDAELKLAFYRELSNTAKDDAIIATNTSGLSINMLSTAVKNPERFLGMHWLNPPYLVPLIEIIKSDHTKKEAADEVERIARSIGKKPVIIKKDVPGFAVNRLQFALIREALALVNEGVVSAEGIDDVMKYSLGFRWASLGPLETMDFGGLDIFYHIAEYLIPDLCDSHEVPELLRSHFEAGEYGLKSGRGFYDYEGDAAEKKKAARDQNFKKTFDALYKEK